MQHTKQKIFDKTQKWVDEDEEKVYTSSIPVVGWMEVKTT